MTDEKFARPDARPLYAQVRDILSERISSGVWRPGQLLPSEFQLASELQVSQGTVRKALDTMTDASLVRRRQGRGTFVIEHTSSQVLFKFFQIYDDKGNRVLPGVSRSSFSTRKPTAEVAKSLDLDRREEVIQIHRVRTDGDRAFLAETIYLPCKMFPGFAKRHSIPNTLYDLFQKEFGVTIANVAENLTAASASKKLAKDLDIEFGTPLLVIDRIALDINQTPVERRISYCLAEGYSYRARL